MVVSSVVGTEIFLLIVVPVITIMTRSAEIIFFRVFHLHCTVCRFWCGIVPSCDGNNVVMWNVSSVAWFKVINNNIFLLKFYVISLTCDSFIFVWLAKASVAFADPTLNCATAVVDNKVLSIQQRLLSDQGGVFDWCS